MNVALQIQNNGFSSHLGKKGKHVEEGPIGSPKKDTGKQLALLVKFILLKTSELARKKPWFSMRDELQTVERLPGR